MGMPEAMPSSLRGRPLRVAFVACNRNRGRYLEDPSFLYRCRNVAAALERLGHDVTVTHLSRLSPWADLDLAVFHRPRNNIALRGALALLRRRRVRAVADVDDLIFDARLARFSPGVLNRLVSLADTEALFTSHHKALARFEQITVSTAPLEDEVRRCLPGADVERLPNAVHHGWLRQANGEPELGDQRPIITYLPGTRSHDRDFATVAPVLNALLRRHAELEVHVTGPLTFELNGRPGQVQHLPRVPFDQLHPRIRSGWLNIAPLEATPFNRCKSALKVLEAGYWGIPTICSPLPDAQRLVPAGAIIATTAEQWFEHIERQLLEPSYRASLTAGLRERVLARADVFEVAEKLVKLADGEAMAA